MQNSVSHSIVEIAIAVLFSRSRKLFPLRTLSVISFIHNGQGLKKEDRQTDGKEDVFSSGGWVGNHIEPMHSGPFVVIGRKGSAGKVTYASKGGWVTDTAYFAVPLRSEDLDCKFLFYALRSLDFSNDIISTAIPGINRTAIYQHTIPVPPLPVQLEIVRFLDAVEARPLGNELPQLSVPLAEQRRTLARVEEAAALINEARRLRQLAETEAKAMQVAVMRRVFTSCGGDIIPLEQACSAIIDNLHRNPHYSDMGIPCIRSPDVGYGTLNLDAALRTDEAEYQRRTVRGEPRPNDIVLVREGGGTGKCALMLPGQRFSLGQRVMMIRPDVRRVVPQFFLYQLLSPVMQEDQILPLCKGSASPHLNIGALRRFAFRLPGIEEQHRIVSELDAFYAEAHALKLLQADTAIELDALLPSIQDNAVKGHL
jgi:type I restriction enzyme S subunit